MFEILEKALLTALGAVSLSQKKAEELFQEIRSRFDMTEEEGKALLARIREFAKENQQKMEEVAQQEIRNACERLGLVKGEELEKLRLKVQLMETQLVELEKRR